MKKILLLLLAVGCVVYMIHGRATTSDASESGSFLSHIQQFFTQNNNEEAKIEPAAGAEIVLQGTRPAERSVCAVVLRQQEEPVGNEVEMAEATEEEAEPEEVIFEEDELGNEPMTEETEPMDVEKTEEPVAAEEEVDIAAPEEDIFL